jgi:nucleotide-binding universal stress UspA family protein
MSVPTDRPGVPTDKLAAADEPRPRVVVGIDGSPDSRAALVQALLAAARRDADLDVVTCFSVELYYLGGAPLDVPDVPRIREAAERRAQDVVNEVLEEVPVSGVPGVKDVDVRLFVVQGGPAHTLTERSRGADLLVVGSRGRGAVRSALLGSVALHSITHAACPVLVVHRGVGRDASPRVVVGLDGSAASAAALALAVDEAAGVGAAVEVVTTYALENYWTDLSSIVIPSVDEIRRRLREQAERMVEQVLSGRAARGQVGAPEVTIDVVEGAAGEVLVHRSRTADLLVVGSRGHGTVRGLLLGSVALDCAMRGQCPVLVVHPPAARPSTTSADAPATMAAV